MASRPPKTRIVETGDHDPQVTEKSQRRVFYAAYKLSILQQADQCEMPGEIGALLRREGLYSSPQQVAEARAGGGVPSAQARER